MDFSLTARSMTRGPSAEGRTGTAAKTD